jgi:NADPH:quinone reductase
MTAGTALYRCQALPPPWSPRTSTAPPLPLIIYGASSSLGCFAIKLARASNIHPILAICGSSSSYVSTLLDASKGDTVIDYRPGVEAMKAAVKEALGPLEAFHALDAISANGTWVPLSQMVSPDGGQVSVVSGANAYIEVEIPAGVKIKYVYVGTAHYGAYVPTMPKQPADKEAVESAVEFAYVFFRYVARLLAKGTFEGHPYTVVPGGLGGVEGGLQMLKAGESRGKKFVYRIEETEGLGDSEDFGDDE